MSDTSDTAIRVEREARTWASQLPLIFLTAFVAAVFGLGGAFGSRMVGASDSTLVLSTKVDQILEQNRAQDAKLIQSEATSREILVRLSNLYTREEAARDREAAERRFQRLEQGQSDAARRIESLEMIVRALQQSFIDRSNKRP